MNKTIRIQAPALDGHGTSPITIDVAKFVERTRSGEDPGKMPWAWAHAGLVAVSESGKYAITPRGEDLIATAHLLPDDPEPEQPAPEPCDACGGTGEQHLFVSTHACDECLGSGHAKTDQRVLTAGIVVVAEPAQQDPPHRDGVYNTELTPRAHNGNARCYTLHIGAMRLIYTTEDLEHGTQFGDVIITPIQTDTWQSDEIGTWSVIAHANITVGDDSEEVYHAWQETEPQ